MRYLIPLILALPLSALCPVTIKCTYHGAWGVTRTSTEYRNGKEFGIYEHTYFDGNGRQQKCRLIVECN